MKNAAKKQNDKLSTKLELFTEFIYMDCLTTDWQE
jgi:hypothetical protein